VKVIHQQTPSLPKKSKLPQVAIFPQLKLCRVWSLDYLRNLVLGISEPHTSSEHKKKLLCKLEHKFIFLCPRLMTKSCMVKNS